MIPLFHRSTMAVLVALLAVCLGCDAAESRPQKHQDRPATRQTLTPQRARQAVIDLIEQMPAEQQPYFQLAELRNGKGIAILDDLAERYFTTHTWNCCLKERWFIFSGPFRPGGCHREDHGVFEYVGGKWVARINGQSWACSGI